MRRYLALQLYESAASTCRHPIRQQRYAIEGIRDGAGGDGLSFTVHAVVRGSPIDVIGMLSPSLAAVQSASVIVLEPAGACAPAPADQMRAAAPAPRSIHIREWLLTVSRSYLKSLGTKSFRLRRHVNHS